MNIERVIENANEENQQNINWTKAWSGKYPILANYQSEVDIKRYSKEIRRLIESLKTDYGYSQLDAFLVLKDILYHEMKGK